MTYKLEQTQYMIDHIHSYDGWEEQAPQHIHELSLEIADLFNEAYDEDAWEDADDLLEVYRYVRRELPKDDQGKRYKALEAHAYMTNNPLTKADRLAVEANPYV